MEYDSLRIRRVKSEHFIKVPCDGFSFAVFIGCEPHHIGVLSCLLELADRIFLICRNLIFRRKIIIEVYSYSFFLKVAYMSVGREHSVPLTKEFFNGFSFCR